ncbi:MAG: ABC transporter substrate-binding protein [Candidatus Sericytochromatia bacterium]
MIAKKNIICSTVVLSLLSFVSFPVFANSEVKDFFGRAINIPAKPQRIISLTPATTEILFSLDLKNKIIGVTSDCNYPEEATKKEKIGKFGFINLEKVISLKPDLIIATKDMNNQLNVLKKYNVPIIAIQTKNLNSVISNIKLLADITGNKKEGKDLSDKLNKKLDKIKNISLKSKKHPKVFYCIWHNPIMTTGKNSFISDMIRTTGAINISDEINLSFSAYNVENLLVKNPDYIVIPESTYKSINFSTIPWNRLKAVKNNQVIKVNDDMYLRPSPRIFDATEELQIKLQK